MQRLLVCLMALGACGEDNAGPTSFDGTASCEGLADAVIAGCPDRIVGRLGAIEDCENDRIEYEPIGCGGELADWALCAESEMLDCEDDELGCGAYRDALRECQRSFQHRTGCSRNGITSDVLMCVPGMGRYAIETEGLPHSYNCLGPVPDNCERNPESVTLSCCTPFVDEPGAHFEPFEPTQEDLPPDYSEVDFRDRAQCLDFADGERWGSCAESVGCACDSCPDEIAACAAQYSCLFSRRCSLGLGCDPNGDPFFTGYGPAASLEAALEDCMNAAECEPRCM